MNRPAAALELTDARRATLEVLARSSSAPHQQVRRAQALLLAAAGEANTRIAERLGVTVVTVRSWRARFERAGLADLGVIRPGRGRKPSIAAEKVRSFGTKLAQSSWGRAAVAVRLSPIRPIGCRPGVGVSKL